MRADGSWRSIVPVLLAVGTFAGLNALATFEPTRSYLLAVPRPLLVFLLGGSVVALAFLTGAVRSGWLTRSDLGLGPEGWTAPRRLAGLVLLAALSYGQFAVLVARHPAGSAAPAPTWGDYGFNYFVCLAPSLAELLVFLGMAFCWVERWLRARGVGRVGAAAAATVFASVGFGLFHFTYPPLWHPYVVPLMGEMLGAVVFFVATRNFWLTLALHTATAAIGFTAMQEDLGTKDFRQAPAVVVMALAFVLPFLYLHWLEWRQRPAPAAK